MERTINGSGIAEILAALAENFPEEVFKDNPAGYAYIPYEVYRERLDRVVGIMNYDFTLSQVEWVSVGEKTHISCIGTLSIRDDAGRTVTVKSATGDADVICKKGDGAAVKSGNDAKTAAHDAFKSCCRMLGIGDGQLRDKRKGKTASKPGGTAGTAAAQTETVERVRVTGAFSALAGKGYKAPAVFVSTGEKVSLILWKEGIEAVQKYMPIGDFLMKYKDREFNVVGARNTFRMKDGATEEQFVMLRPYSGKEAS